MNQPDLKNPATPMPSKPKPEDYCIFPCQYRGKGATNKAGFCTIGFAQNPRSKEATKKALLNKARICRFNPWKLEIVLRKKGDKS